MANFVVSTLFTSKGADKLTSDLMSVKGAAATVATALVASTKLAIDYQQSLIGVGKTSDLTGVKLEGLGTRLDNLTRTSIPASVGSLLTLAETAGQLGVKGADNIVLFTETLAKLETTTNIVGAEGAQQIARLLDVVGEGAGNVENFANVVVELGNNFAIQEASLLTYTTRIGQATAMFGVASHEAAALGTAMGSIGVAPELAASSVGRAMDEMQRAVASGGEALQNMASLAGVSSQQFADAWQTNALDAFELFLQGVQNAGQGASLALEDVGLSGTRLSQTLPALAKRLDVLTEARKRANEQAKNGTALEKEFALFMGSTKNQLKLLGNEITSFGRAIGKNFLGPVADAAKLTRQLISETRSLSGPLSDVSRSYGDMFDELGKAIGGTVELTQAGKDLQHVYDTLDLSDLGGAAGAFHTLRAVAADVMADIVEVTGGAVLDMRQFFVDGVAKIVTNLDMVAKFWADVLRNIGLAIPGGVFEAFFDNLANAAQGSTSDMVDRLGELRSEIDDNRESLADLVAGFRSVSTDQMNAAIEESNRALRELGATAEDTRNKVDGFGGGGGGGGGGGALRPALPAGPVPTFQFDTSRVMASLKPVELDMSQAQVAFIEAGEVVTDQLLNSADASREFAGALGSIGDLMSSLGIDVGQTIESISTVVTSFGEAIAMSSGQGSDGTDKLAKAASMANVWIAVAVALVDAFNDIVDSRRGKQFGPTVAIGGNNRTGVFRFGGEESVLGDNSDDPLGAEVFRSLREGLNNMRIALGGFVEFIPGLNLSIRQDGEKVRLMIGDQVMSTFATFAEAASAGMDLILEQAEFSGLGEILEAAMGNASRIGSEAFLELVPILKEMDGAAQGLTVAQSKALHAANQWAVSLDVTTESLIDLGVSAADIVDWREREIAAMAEQVRQGGLNMIGISTQAAALAEWQAATEGFAQAAQTATEQTNRITDEVIAGGPPLPGGGATGGGGGRGSGVGQGSGSIRDVDAGKLSDDLTQFGEVVRTVGGDIQEASQIISTDFVDAISEVVSLNAQMGFLGELQAFQDKFNVELIGNQKLAQQIAEMEFKAGALKIQLLIQELALNQEILGISDAQIKLWQGVAAELSTMDFPGLRGGGRGGRGNRRQERADITQMIEDMEAGFDLLGGAADELARFRQETEETIEAMQRLGMGELIADFERLRQVREELITAGQLETIEGRLADILGDEELLAELQQARQVAQLAADRAQIEALLAMQQISEETAQAFFDRFAEALELLENGPTLTPEDLLGNAADQFSEIQRMLENLGMSLPTDVMEQLADIYEEQARAALMAALATDAFREAADRLGVDVEDLLRRIALSGFVKPSKPGDGEDEEDGPGAGIDTLTPASPDARLGRGGGRALGGDIPDLTGPNGEGNALAALLERMADISRGLELDEMSAFERSLAEIGDFWADFTEQLRDAGASAADLAEAERLMGEQRTRAAEAFSEQARASFASLLEEVQGAGLAPGSLAAVNTAERRFLEARAELEANPTDLAAISDANRLAAEFFRESQAAGFGSFVDAREDLLPFLNDAVSGALFDPDTLLLEQRQAQHAELISTQNQIIAATQTASASSQDVASEVSALRSDMAGLRAMMAENLEFARNNPVN